MDSDAAPVTAYPQHGMPQAAAGPAPGGYDAPAGEPVVTMRILLNSKGAGVAIGKQGATIEELREVSGTKAGVSKSVEGVNDRILSIAGTVPQIAKAVNFLARTLIATPSMTFQPPLPPNQTMLRLLVPNAIMGSVIGRAGARIKQLQDAHGVRLVATKEPLPASTERLTDITGTPEGIEGAATEVAQALADDWDRVCQSTTLYDPRVRMRHTLGPAAGYMPQQHPQQQQQQGGMVSPAVAGPVAPVNGAGAQQAAYAPRGGFHGGAASAGYPAQQQQPAIPAAAGAPLAQGRQHHARGHHAHHQQHHQQHHHHQQQHQPQQQHGGFHGGAGTHSRGHTGDFIPRSDDPNAVTQMLAIPAGLVGSIIGKAGSRIAEIREASGAKIAISKMQNENGERTFTIVGTQPQNDVALKMLYDQLTLEKNKRVAMQQQQQAQAAAAAAAATEAPAVSADEQPAASAAQ
ncbi:RNA binding protein, heterogenous nuclear RNP-K like protein [Blastocladiella emersonii ATCC 22665]|nr:RNA binding protein, heterogenous nuclear RNP-K like protein [Blastocladiella emersonii ATCC 22665]